MRQLYRDLLWHEGDDEGIAYWTEALGNASMSRDQLVEFFINTEEFQGGVGTLTRLYEGALGRAPDVCGLDYWMAQHADGLNLAISAQVILESDEFAQRQGDLSDDALIDTLTQSMLGREATPDERGQWEQALANGTSTGSLLLTLANSEDYRAQSAETVSLDLFYLGLLNREPDAAGRAYWQEEIADADTPFTFIGSFFMSTEYHDRFLPPTESAALELTGLAPNLDGLSGL
ncbi:DUF4214 domain-containing protein [Allochromatium palmeri]|uniref:DUF4214 domain-containing protein n=1 Tax=Allochromatium palmeri TaxID=231048 RepID=UPI0016433F41